MLRFLREGDEIMCDITDVQTRKNRRGETVYTHVRKLILIGGREGDRRRGDREFLLRGLTKTKMTDLIAAEEAKGASFSPYPSLDQRRLVS